MKMIVFTALCLLSTASAGLLTNLLGLPVQQASGLSSALTNLFGTPGQKAPAQPVCSTEVKADVFFLIDESSSIDSISFITLKKFLIDLLPLLNYGPDYTRVAIGSFATNYRPLCKFNEYPDLDDIVQFISNIKQVGGYTYTAEAITKITTGDILTNPAWGRRPGVQGLFIFVTDGQSRDSAATIAAAAKLRFLKFLTYVILVGSVNRAEAIGIAGTSANVFSVKSYNELNTIAATITTVICTVPQAPPPPPCISATKYDVYFFVDESGSINSADWAKVINLLINIVTSVNVGPRSIQFGLGLFSNNFEAQFDFNTYTKSADIVKNIKAVVKRNGGTFTADCLLAALNGGRFTRYGRRADADLIIVVCTDGQSENTKKTIDAAAKVKRETGATINVLTIGKVDQDEALGIAGNANNVHNAKNFNALGDFLKIFVQKLCEAPPTTTTTTTTPRPTTTTTTTPRPTTTTTTTPKPTTTTTTPKPTTTTTTPKPTTTTTTTTTPKPTTTTTTTTPRPTTTTTTTTTTPPPTTTTTTPEPTTTTTTPPPTTTTTTTPQPTPPPTVKPCPAATIVDIIFVVDSSGSIAIQDYDYNFQFIQRIIDGYYISEDGTKVALLTFGSSVKPKFKLSGNAEFIRQQLQNVTYQGSTTETGLALNYVVDNGWYTPANGARNGSIKILIVITDGQSSHPNDTLKAADRCKAAGLTIIVVGVGKSVDKNEIDAVASTLEYAITVDDYSVLDYIASKTSDIACNKGQKVAR